jgi:putative addiction module component (TIGR02574 family)
VDHRRKDQESGQQAEAMRLLREVNALPLDVRLQLVMDTWDGIAASPEDVPVPESHLRELESRLQSLEAGADERLERDVTEWIDQVQDDEGWTE